MSENERIIAIFKENYALKEKKKCLEAQKFGTDWEVRGSLQKEIDLVWGECRKLEKEVEQIIKAASKYPLVNVAFKYDQGYIAGQYWLGSISFFKGEVIVEE